MAERFSLEHIDISALARVRGFQADGSGPRLRIVRQIRAEHGGRLMKSLRGAFIETDEYRAAQLGGHTPDGTYIEVDLISEARPASLEKRSLDIRPGATIIDEEKKIQHVTLFVPDSARQALARILEDYTNGPLTKKGNPPHKSYVDVIEEIRRAHLRDFWTDDPKALPESPEAELWWEAWCWRDRAERVRGIAEKLGARVANKDRFLVFPEQTVIPIYASRYQVEMLLFAAGGIVELRRASDNPTFFTIESRDEQRDWAEDLAARTIWPGSDAPAVCLFDTGVNRAHPLLEPALSPEDVQAVDAAWGGDDHDAQYGHGTGMAGLALHGDLMPLLAGHELTPLRHRLESVKLLPPSGFDANDPRNYGAITQAAVALPEIVKSGRQRVYCMAISNRDASGAVPTTWSGAIDQAASGTMPGDIGADPQPRRLFILSSGNILDTVATDLMGKQEQFPIEDPAQAWNALSIGGYTDKVDISEPELKSWRPFAGAGCLSPFSRTSVQWRQSETPYKPDLVLEAGNRALSPSGEETLAGVESLSLLTTGRDAARRPLDAFWATSASTAQAARMAGVIMGEYPDLWPETIRALLVHSATWTLPMYREIRAANKKRERYALLRRYGYGVPNLERALRSAQDHVALISQREIQPFKSTPDGAKFAEAHVYPLPWPTSLLEDLQNVAIKLKVTLSYFIEPYPGAISSIDPYRYQSFGLRFDLKRKGETRSQFLQRINALERDDPKKRPQSVSDSGWWFGTNSFSAGSLHSDVWEGPAVDLAARNMLWIYPVTGWWRERPRLGKTNARGRYALIATISAPDVELHTSISTQVETMTDIDIEIGV
jgi:hypothetical protein